MHANSKGDDKWQLNRLECPARGFGGIWRKAPLLPPITNWNWKESQLHSTPLLFRSLGNLLIRTDNNIRALRLTHKPSLSDGYLVV